MSVIPKPQRLAVIDALVAVAAPFAGALVGLYQEPHTPNAEDTFATYDAMKADFPGYAPSAAVVWGPTFYGEADEAVTEGDRKQFNAGAIVAPQTLYGYYLFRGAELLQATQFEEPKVVNEEFDAVSVTPRLSFLQ